jgi:T-complex protein 1 subunit epsilon
MSGMMIDENGRPIILLHEQADKKRVKGTEAYRGNILAARGIANVLKSSLGPKGLDKMLVRYVYLFLNCN